MKSQNHKSVSFALYWGTAIGMVAITASLTGCSDPSDKVTKSSATAAQEVSKPAATARQYVLGDGSTIGFVGSKVTGSHTGGFKKFDGKVSVAAGKISAAEVKIDMDSTWSDNDRLTGHLKNADFFDVPKFPTSTFTLSGISTESGTNTVTGNLELHGVTKSISFPADIRVTDDAVTLKAEFAINRREFNINYAGKANDLIRDHVVLKLDINATPGEPRPNIPTGN